MSLIRKVKSDGRTTKMIPLDPDTIRKRGCPYCADVIILTKAIWPLEKGQCCCPYDKCPYKVLNNYKSYNAYLKTFHEESKE